MNDADPSDDSRGHLRVLIVGVCFAAVALAVASARSVNTPPRAAAPVERLTVAATAYVGNCSIAVADANEYFAYENLQVTVHAAPTGRDALAAVMEHRADVATVADVPVMFAALAGQPVAIIATIATGTRDHGIVARRDRGVVSPGDLRGRRIGVPIGTSAHFFLDAFLNRQKLSAGEVRPVDTAPDELSTVLASGEVDAIAVWQPFARAAVDRLGSTAVAFHGEGVYDVMYNLATSSDLAVRRQAAFERFLRTIARGADFCQNQPGLAQQIVADAVGLDRSRVEAFWPSYRFRVGLHQALLLALEDQTRWAIRNHLSPAPAGYNFLDHLRLDPLRAAAPASVTVIH